MSLYLITTCPGCREGAELWAIFAWPGRYFIPLTSLLGVVSGRRKRTVPLEGQHFISASPLGRLRGTALWIPSSIAAWRCGSNKVTSMAPRRGAEEWCWCGKLLQRTEQQRQTWAQASLTWPERSWAQMGGVGQSYLEWQCSMELNQQCVGVRKKKVCEGEVQMIWLFGDLSVIAFCWLRLEDRRTGCRECLQSCLCLGKAVENMWNRVGKAAILSLAQGSRWTKLRWWTPYPVCMKPFLFFIYFCY